MDRKEVVFVLGGPGSGKGTHCARVATEFGYTHLSTGDLLRKEQTKNSDLAATIAECIKDGKLVTSSTMVALLKEAIIKGASKRFLLDGFPRSKENLDAWFEEFSDDEVQVSFTLFLHCPKDELKKRLLERGQTSGRADDNVDTVLKRFDTFERESLPVVELLDRLGMVRKVSTVPARELVSHRVMRFFRGCRLVDPVERTLALIKPDAADAGKAVEIIARAEEEGFVVVGNIEGQTWSKENAEEFYSEHRGKPFFDTLVDFMSSGPIVQLCLEKVNAIKEWRKLAGPTNSGDAKASAPSSLRALYGTDGTKNAVHGSDSFASALRELNFCFDKAAAASRSLTSESRLQREGQEMIIEAGQVVDDGFGSDGFAKNQETLALLKPGVSELHSADILGVLAYRGFTVRESATKILDDAEARRFYQKHASETWFEDMCFSLAGRGETTALCLSRVKAVAACQAVVGPTDPGEARISSPRSLRAIYGEDAINDAVHASSSSECAARELEFWFPLASRNVASCTSAGQEKTAAPGDPEYDEMMAFMKEKVDPIISPLLHRVLKARPQNVASFAAQDLKQLALSAPPSEASQAS